MEKVLLIGCAGAGKTTFAKALADKLGLPLVHLDSLYWVGNWEHRSREDFDRVLQAELDKPRWILDGNYNRTLPLRLQHCDTVFYFDYPTVTCLSGITKRTLTNLGKPRADMGGNCPERFDRRKWELYRNVISFNKQHRQTYHKLLAEAKNARVVIFKNRRQAREFLENL